MKWCVALLALTWISVNAGQGGEPRQGPAKLAWKKTVVDKVFRSEGVAVADVNKDGKADIITGDVWYEAPDWKMHSLRTERDPKRAPKHAWKPEQYSESFAVFADDFNGDGYPDVIVIPFPGKACYWYENPKGKNELWKEHLLTTSACNETPIYVELFGKGNRVLVMAWQPDKQNNMGEMCYFTPGKDPTQPWQRHSISGPSMKGKEVPYTQRFSHGLGHGDVNGDGRVDILCPGGWWEQPAQVDGKPWKFHAAELGPVCADMFTYDIDGDGKADVVSSSAHKTGLWWHQQKPGKAAPLFVRHDLFLPPLALAKEPKEYPFKKEEQALYAAINKARGDEWRAPWRPNLQLWALARKFAEQMAADTKVDWSAPDYKGKLVFTTGGVFSEKDNPAAIAKGLIERHLKHAVAPDLEIGIGFARTPKGIFYAVLVGDRKLFAVFGQSHALHCVDVNGDGLKDLVTGRRWWAHGPKGDDYPSDPAYIYWFEAKRDKTGFTTFVPHQIDDGSGIGTQFAVNDINGDMLLDIIISNKRGVYVFEQVRTGATSAPRPEPKKE